MSEKKFHRFFEQQMKHMIHIVIFKENYNYTITP